MTISATNPNETRVVEPKRVLTPARLVALVLIGLAALGLAYLRFAPDDRISVPAGAEAGDLVLEDCD